MSMRSPPPTAWRLVIAMLALVAATAVTNAATLATDHPRRSCRAHRDDGNAAQDGEYPLLVPSGEMVVVYCHMMGHNAASEPGAPFEYITLPAPLSPGAGGGLVNAAQWVMGPFVTTTTFTRVRLDFRNLTIRTGDCKDVSTLTHLSLARTWPCDSRLTASPPHRLPVSSAQHPALMLLLMSRPAIF